MKRNLLFLILLLSVVAVGQTPGTTGSISGRVTDADTHAAVAGAKVGSRELGYATTDADGKFILQNVAAGSVRVGIQDRNGGYLDMTLTPPRRVTVVAGRQASGVDFQTRLDAQISGRVFDADGNPLAAVRVSPIQQQYPGGPNLLELGDDTAKYELFSNVARAGVTDDRGAYTIDGGMLAGRPYWLVARLERTYSTPLSDSPADARVRKRTLAATYYPRASSVISAVPITLHSLEHRDNVDIHMLSMPSYCVEATLTDSGRPASMRFQFLEEELYRMTPGLRTNGESGPDGRIRVCDAYPGQYSLIAAGPGLPRLPASFGQITVTVDSGDIKDVKLDALAPVTLSGEIRWDKDPPDSLRNSTARIRPRPVYGPMPGPPIAIPGSFSMDALRSVPYNLTVVLPPPLYVKEATYDGSTIVGKPILAQSTDAKVRLTVGTDGGSITARSTPGAALFIISAAARSEAELARTLVAGLTDDDGSFVARAIPPGRYYVLATNNPPPGRLVLPQEYLLLEKIPESLALLMHVRSKGSLITLASGAAADVRVEPQLIN